VLAGVLVADARGEVELPAADGAGEFRAGNPEDFDGRVVVGLAPLVAPPEPTPGNGAPCRARKADVVLSEGAKFPHKTAQFFGSLGGSGTADIVANDNLGYRLIGESG
jgi:hypothetical protein